MSAHNKALRLADLPNGALTHAASYLAPPSQALFALAMEGAVDHNKMEAILTQEQIWCMGRVISGTEVCRRTGRRFEDWRVLDFGTVEASLASRMTDALIEKMLARIDAFDKLRELRLTGCVDVVGSCFAPLRGSRRLEFIDISLAHYQKHGKALFAAHGELKASGCAQLWRPLIQGVSAGGTHLMERRGLERQIEEYMSGVIKSGGTVDSSSGGGLLAQVREFKGGGRVVDWYLVDEAPGGCINVERRATAEEVEMMARPSFPY